MLALLLVVFLPALAAVQEPPAPAEATAVQAEVQGEMDTVQDLLVRAQAEFDGTQQSRSIVLFDEIVERLERLRLQDVLPARGREILLQAYDLRGRAYYNIGLQEKAADSFRSLIELDPRHALSREEVSPKIVDFFGSVKKSLVGALAASSNPPGARVSLDGEFVALTDFFPIDVLAGEYTVEVVREGYGTQTRTVSIAPGATETLSFDLVRTAASCFFVTEPAGVEVWVDGELRATTSGSLHPDLHAAVLERGLDPARASARTEVANLSLGQHAVEFRKACYETVRSTLDVPEPVDYETEPLRMEESLASLSLRSEPPGARIFLDGQPMGQTPRDLDGICSGRHRLEVKHASGEFVQDISLARNEQLSLDCPIRPSLAFLGVLADAPAARRVAPEVEEKLVENLAKVHTLNFVPAPAEVVDRVLAGEGVTRRVFTVPEGTGPDVVRRVTEKLAAALEVQGFLVAELSEERLQRTAQLYLLAAGNTVPDRWDVVFRESASYGRLLSLLDRQVEVYRPWAGLVTVDTRTREGAPIIRVVPGSPAEQAGLQPGWIVLSTDGARVRATSDVRAAVAAKRPGDVLTLEVAAGGSPRSVSLTLGETPREIALHDPNLLYNKVMMDLRQRADGYPGTEAAAFARLNMGLCAMHFGDFATAHEHLAGAKPELPVRAGLSRGTAAYYLAVSLERLGYAHEAAEAYREAARYPDATLIDNDGLPVAALAARRAGQ